MILEFNITNWDRSEFFLAEPIRKHKVKIFSEEETTYNGWRWADELEGDVVVCQKLFSGDGFSR